MFWGGNEDYNIVKSSSGGGVVHSVNDIPGDESLNVQDFWIDKTVCWKEIGY